jgi:deazaflavin-dependent oxidoreductase (nitroreductase family)
MAEFQQRDQGLFVYPRSGWRRLLVRAPLTWWRLGLEPLLRRFHFIVVTTRGRASGQARHTMLEHSVLDGRIYIAPGWGRRTQWYRNLLADPALTVQRHGETFAATARPVTDGDELARVFHVVRGVSPVWGQFLASWEIEDTLEDYLAKKDRVPTIRLDRIAGPPPLPPLARDLVWLWAVLAAILALVLVALPATRASVRP